jgi:transcription initiation factor IIF auxiliary subunit
MIKRTAKQKILQRLELLDKAAPSNEPFIVFVEQLDSDEFQVSKHISKGVGRVEIESYKVSNLEDFYSMNSKYNCPVIIENIGLEDESEV